MSLFVREEEVDFEISLQNYGEKNLIEDMLQRSHLLFQDVILEIEEIRDLVV